MIKKAFTEHPASVGESYFEHMGVAFKFGGELSRAAVCCVLHGLFPFLFVKTGSRCIEKLHHDMVTHRDRNAAVSCGKMPSLIAEKSLEAAE